MRPKQKRFLLPEDVRYLVFEGGGGKGAAYQGVFEVLTDVGLLSKIPGVSHNIDGVAGASAGALTALYVALGYTADQLREELKDESKFLNLLDEARPGLLRGVKLGKVDGRTQGVPYVAHWGPAPSIGQPWDRPFDKPDQQALAQRQKQAWEWVDNIKVRLLASLLLSRRIAGTVLAQSGKAMAIQGAGLNTAAIEALLASQEEFAMLHDDVLADAILHLVPKEDRGVIIPYVKKIFGNSRRDLAKRVHALGYDRGLFSGFALRDYCVSVIANRFKMTHELASGLTFRELRNRTRMDLCVSGTNITQRRSAYFSPRHTPEFPVADAVALSMSLPFVFKPVLVHTGGPAVVNESDYAGLWVDGGVLNNLPIHAFDVGTTQEPFAGSLNKHVLAFRLFSGSKPTDDHILRKPPMADGMDSDPIFSDLFRHVGDFYETLVSPSEEGQLRTPEEEDRTIKIFAGELSTLDFSGAKAAEGVKNARIAVQEYFEKARVQSLKHSRQQR